MAKLNKLEKRYLDLLHETLNVFLEGNGEEYSNMDIMKYKPGTIHKINELLSRRAEVSKLMDDEKDE